MRALFALDLDDDPEEVRALYDDGRALLERLGATVDVLTVDAGPLALPADHPDLPPELFGALAKRTAARRERLEALLGTVPAERRGRAEAVADGRTPAEGIVNRASGHDLVVVGTHARRGMSRVWLGSVAEKVVRASPVPVLVLPPAPLPRLSEGPRALVAVDVHPDPDPLMAAAGRWASALGAALDAVYVTGLPDPGTVQYGPVWAQEARREVAVAEQRLADALARLPAEVRGTARVERGLPATKVPELAAGYALLVVGTHQHRGLTRLLLGSVAERIVRAATVPVLVLPVG